MSVMTRGGQQVVDLIAGQRRSHESGILCKMPVAMVLLSTSIVLSSFTAWTELMAYGFDTIPNSLCGFL